MEIATNGKLPFLGMLLDNGPRISSCVYRKPTDKGLLLHYHSHVDHRYKTCLTGPIGCPQVGNYSLVSAKSSKISSKALNTQKT